MTPHADAVVSDHDRYGQPIAYPRPSQASTLRRLASPAFLAPPARAPRESCHIAAGVAYPTTLAAGQFADSAVEVAYLTRWLKLEAGKELRGWRTLCERAAN